MLPQAKNYDNIDCNQSLTTPTLVARALVLYSVILRNPTCVFAICVNIDYDCANPKLASEGAELQ